MDILFVKQEFFRDIPIALLEGCEENAEFCSESFFEAEVASLTP